MTFNLTTTSAIILSSTTVILCLIGLIRLYRDLQDIRFELDTEMDNFKVFLFIKFKKKFRF